ncbi:hypothetical protein B296_00056278 [Ensete ventricosum]|uniref:Secreted protein n=1 Tax=Ensete ventricosum TaxID=4639 RepID=A0A426XVR2_ENSVE|nr:hypothetical protein B296_00056278 [Ensete ventricosum]
MLAVCPCIMLLSGVHSSPISSVYSSVPPQSKLRKPASEKIDEHREVTGHLSHRRRDEADEKEDDKEKRRGHLRSKWKRVANSPSAFQYACFSGVEEEAGGGNYGHHHFRTCAWKGQRLWRIRVASGVERERCVNRRRWNERDTAFDTPPGDSNRVPPTATWTYVLPTQWRRLNRIRFSSKLSRIYDEEFGRLPTTFMWRLCVIQNLNYCSRRTWRYSRNEKGRRSVSAS